MITGLLSFIMAVTGAMVPKCAKPSHWGDTDKPPPVYVIIAVADDPEEDHQPDHQHPPCLFAYDSNIALRSTDIIWQSLNNIRERSGGRQRHGRIIEQRTAMIMMPTFLLLVASEVVVMTTCGGTEVNITPALVPITVADVNIILDTSFNLYN